MSCHVLQADRLVLAGLPGANVSKGDLPDGPKPIAGGDPGSKAASGLSKAADKAGEKTPDVNVPGFGPFKFNPKEDAKQAAKKSPLGSLQVSGLFDMVMKAVKAATLGRIICSQSSTADNCLAGTAVKLKNDPADIDMYENICCQETG